MFTETRSLQAFPINVNSPVEMEQNNRSRQESNKVSILSRPTQSKVAKETIAHQKFRCALGI
jgi:hypothetical protein